MKNVAANSFSVSEKLRSICALGRKELKFGKGYLKNENKMSELLLCEGLGVVFM